MCDEEQPRGWKGAEREGWSWRPLCVCVDRKGIKIENEMKSDEESIDAHN
jgi:hypothetical protein